MHRDRASHESCFVASKSCSSRIIGVDTRNDHVLLPLLLHPSDSPHLLYQLDKSENKKGHSMHKVWGRTAPKGYNVTFIVKRKIMLLSHTCFKECFSLFLDLDLLS
ncbi:hypothetical protein S245_047214 [Arachis hypogaea]